MASSTALGSIGCEAMRAPGAEEFSIVPVAAIDGEPGVRPAARQFVASAAERERIPDDGLARHDGLRPWR